MNHNPTIPEPGTSDCPAILLFDRLANKWALRIIRRLRCESVRFNQLRRDMDGISQKVLSQTLKKLERDGLIRRHALATTVPLTVEYSLTEIGITLSDTIETLHHWIESNIDAVEKAQHNYDVDHDFSDTSSTDKRRGHSSHE
jgi:DNA-binding HxlR family transcriptional regulator